MQYLNSQEKRKVENYPYGFREKTEKYFSLEFKNKKGFRMVGQTVNPKTGELNKPKKSTYSPCGLLTVDENNHVNFHTEDFYNDEGKTRGWQFMGDNHHNFTKEEIQFVASHNLMLLKADIIAKVTYCGSDKEKILPLYSEAFTTLAKIAITGDNLWDEIKIDWEAIDATKIPDYKPFKVTSHSI